MRKKGKVQRKRRTGTKKETRRKRTTRREELVPSSGPALEIATAEPIGLGSNAAGQSGDIEDLPDIPVGDSESVAELVEAGQDLEAEVVSGVESAPEPDEAEVTTHQRRTG